MNNFTIRVSFLREDIPREIYADLARVMEKYEISSIITSDQGRTYRLPAGEFNFIGDIDRKKLLEKVKAAVGELAEKYSVLITESKGRTWFNLQPDGKENVSQTPAARQ